MYQSVVGLADLALRWPACLGRSRKAMSNCVDTYVQSCMDGDSFIFSVRGKGDERLATAEVRFSPVRGSNSHQIVIVQFKGSSNHPVGSQAARALGAFSIWRPMLTPKPG